jgi:hypothetical protein
VNWFPYEGESWDDDERDAEAADERLHLPPGDWRRDRGWRAGENEEDPAGESGRWPLGPHGLLPRERWLWYEQLWTDACMLRERYRLTLRAGWWEDSVQVEALAALAAWVERYDCGEWDDPPGKLALLYDLERVSLLLRDGLEPFIPARDRTAFLRYLLESGAQPPPQAPPVG